MSTLNTTENDTSAVDPIEEDDYLLATDDLIEDDIIDDSTNETLDNSGSVSGSNETLTTDQVSNSTSTGETVIANATESVTAESQS